MRIEAKKGGDRVLLVPETPIDYYHLGLIHGRLASVSRVVSNTDNPESIVESLDISIDELIEGLLGNRRIK